jgi:phytoene desaturase
VSEYNSYKGNAYGMANTLLQTAFLRPKLKKKVKFIFYRSVDCAGPGVPPALISGKLVSELISNFQNNSMKQLFDDVSLNVAS